MDKKHPGDKPDDNHWRAVDELSSFIDFDDAGDGLVSKYRASIFFFVKGYGRDVSSESIPEFIRDEVIRQRLARDHARLENNGNQLES